MPSSRPVAFNLPIECHNRLKRLSEDLFNDDPNRLARWIVMRELERGVKIRTEASVEAGAGNDAGPQA